MKILDKLIKIFKKNKPWIKYYKKDEITIPDINMYDALKESALKYPNYNALNYFDKKITYTKMLNKIDNLAISLNNLGLRKNDIVTILMPNTPEALYTLYASNKIGLIVEMIHPFSSENEILNYLKNTKSKCIFVIDMCYDKIKNIIGDTYVEHIIISKINDSMPPIKNLFYTLFKEKKIDITTKNTIYYEDLIKNNTSTTEIKSTKTKNDCAVILHSGGTTGTPKSIQIKNSSFNYYREVGLMECDQLYPKDTTLGILPIFHGFGLGCTIHLSLTMGLEVILIPQFNAKKFDKLLIKYKPSFIAGVPTLFEALVKCDNRHLDLSCVKYILSGGDSLNKNQAEMVNNFLKKHKSSAKISQGYGLSEATAAVSISFNPKANKPGSIGIPLPGTIVKIVDSNTTKDLGYNTPGEIVIQGPTVMLGYLDNDKETKQVLRRHGDGKIWLHTGDMGYMDTDGVLFYQERMKRMIISSGYNVYPSHIESVLNDHEAVFTSVVVGIPHPYKQEVAKAYIVLKEGYTDNPKLRNSIEEHVKKNLASFSIPYKYEYRESLPKTKMGKVDYKSLKGENNE